MLIFQQTNSLINYLKQTEIKPSQNNATLYLLGIVWRDLESVAADLVGGQRKGLPCGSLQ